MHVGYARGSLLPAAEARGGEFNKKYGNRLMRWRVFMQGAALVLLALAMLSSSD